MIPRSFRFNTRMPSLHDVLCLLALFFECVLHAESMPCRGTATYRLQFQGEWKNSSSRPAGAQFTGFIGAVHNKCYQMWETGERASLGVKNVAEEGNTGELQKEIEKLVKNRTTSLAVIHRHPLLPEGNSLVTESFQVHAIRPFISIIVKISPSPDWFVGAYDVDLCNRENGKWLDVKDIFPVVPYDAGTDSGSYFTSAKRPSDPIRDISRIHGYALKPWTSQERELGLFHFYKESSSDQGSIGEFDSDENFVCPSRAPKNYLSFVIVFLAILCLF
ncbi:spondin-2-like isoform X2 [Dendronephthya gigantea]|uniref:spondin-2-like isoform X2 n=1 Tax=Dendronephthya gigantea TaxID=151771 RepID=UPI00106A446C|nr:spondin-2-like isoform X2 [Dendronephthya gigantea]